MKTNYIFIIALLPELILCASFEWTSSFTESISDSFKVTTSLTSTTGYTHIFMPQSNSQDVMYQKLLPNGDLTSRKSIANNYVYSPKQDLSVKSNDNGTHLLVAYHGLRDKTKQGCNETHKLGCSEVYFIESFTGGDTWSLPIQMPRANMNDAVQRYSPSMAFEKDSGRVYIAYKRGNLLAIAVREPGETNFGPEDFFLDKNNVNSAYLEYTIDTVNSKTHLHLIWYFESAKALYHTESLDYGKTWGTDFKLLEGISLKDPPAVAINTQASESRIYIQYYQGRELKMIWSKNHGKKWDELLRVDYSMNGYANAMMCGTNKTGLVFSVNAKIRGEPGFVRYMNPNNKSITWEKIQYPFPEIPSVSYAKYPEISCGYMGNGTYLLALQVRSTSGGLYYLARGTLDLNKTAIIQ